MIRIPPRTATDAYFATMGGSRRLDLVVDIDLVELVEGHRVVARGMETVDDHGAICATCAGTAAGWLAGSGDGNVTVPPDRSTVKICDGKTRATTWRDLSAGLIRW
ncbi:hypothetical protein [Nonomuraea sp. NPDC049709]|uniref:hypothetical protein n=1 Tax=Nonomuraea sp. NPDC049709 TaxID=3154736 RepID=UPI00341A8998